ncbi:MAG: glycosyltransferase family 2 protein [Segetibacter sp.]
MLPKISIVTPSYNQGKYIEETILSIINQNYSNLEYLIIDGGSTDNSVEIIKKYEKHLAYWVSEKDKGQSDAINKGFKKVTGEIVCWLNSDDILIDGALDKVVSCFRDNKDLDLVNGNLLLIDENSKILSGHFILKQKSWYAKQGIYYVSQPSMFWKRRIFDKVGLLREDFHASMDREFLIRIFKNNFKIGQLDEILAGFRMHSTSKSSAGWENRDYLRDLKVLRSLHGSGYGGHPKLFYKLLYGSEKLIKGIYLKKWLFTSKWKGKHVKELHYNNFKHFQ